MPIKLKRGQASSQVSRAAVWRGSFQQGTERKKKSCSRINVLDVGHPALTFLASGILLVQLTEPPENVVAFETVQKPIADNGGQTPGTLGD